MVHRENIIHESLFRHILEGFKKEGISKNIAFHIFEDIWGNSSTKSISEKRFSTWKTIQLGTGLQTADDFCRALKECDCRVSNWAEDLLGSSAFKAATDKTEVDLVVVSVAELGFKDGATRREIYDRAKELGLELCPPEVGPQLRLQYKDQPMNEWLRIAMEPIAVSGGVLRVFRVGRNVGGLWLGGDYGGPGSFWYGYYRWVFLQRK